MSLLGKLGKLGDKISKKANELVDEASRAAQHKVNSLRDHAALRDITVESKALPGTVQGFVRLLNIASAKLQTFQVEFCGAPAEAVAALTELQQKMHAATVAASAHLGQFTLHMEEILKAEQAVESANKAAAAPPKPGVNHEELVKAAETAQATCAELKKKSMKAALTGLVQAQVETFSAMEDLCGQMLKIVANFPEVYPGAAIPYEALYDEPRPALGNSAAKAPPSEVKRKPHEDLALLPRPVDGDTRAKYAKLWNEEVADVLEAHRTAMREAGRWFALRLELANHLNNWVNSDEANAAFKTTVSCCPIMESQFTQEGGHLSVYIKEYEAVYHGLELQRAPVPAKDVALETPDPQVPKKRSQVAKQALIGSITATLHFAQRGKTEVSNFYASAIGNLPN